MNRPDIPTHGSGIHLLVFAAAFLGLTLFPIGASRASVISNTPDPLPPGGYWSASAAAPAVFPQLGFVPKEGS